MAYGRSYVIEQDRIRAATATQHYFLQRLQPGHRYARDMDNATLAFENVDTTDFVRLTAAGVPGYFCRLHE